MEREQDLITALLLPLVGKIHQINIIDAYQIKFDFLLKLNTPNAEF